MTELRFDNARDALNSVTMKVIDGGEVEITVSEEKPVNGSNMIFDCSFVLTFDQVRELRRFMDNVMDIQEGLSRIPPVMLGA